MGVLFVDAEVVVVDSTLWKLLGHPHVPDWIAAAIPEDNGPHRLRMEYTDRLHYYIDDAEVFPPHGCD